MSILPSRVDESFVLSALNLQPARTADVLALPALSVARNTILEPSGLDESQLAQALGTVMGSAVDGRKQLSSSLTLNPSHEFLL